VRIRPLLLLAPVILAATALLATPVAVRAANGMTETGITTYEVVSSKNIIAVTIKLSITNNTPSVCSGYVCTSYFWDTTYIYMPMVASPVSATSNAGSVSGYTYKTTAYWRWVQLSFPAVWYGQTRVITASYSIPAAPGAAGGFRAGQAYASLCARGSGEDTGSVLVVIPDGFDLSVIAGGDIAKADDSNGKQTFSTGTVPEPNTFATCVEASNPANLTHTPVTAAGQAFDLRAWPEDSSWSASMGAGLGGYVQRLEDLTGLKMPGGTISIAETGGGYDDHGVGYDPSTKVVSIPEMATVSDKVHALSHIWFNRTMFEDTWVSEGLAGYSEQAAGGSSYTPCAEPGSYPGSGSPSLSTWRTLTYDSSVEDESVSEWQHAAACFFFTTLAGAMGPDNFKNVMRAVAAGETAYIGATPNEKLAGSTLPIGARQMLDYLDERGMVPAGISNLDQAQNLLGNWGMFDSTTLAIRSSARAAYHALAAKAGKWMLPLAIRGPMSSWEFLSAQAAMTTAGQILDIRNEIESRLSGFSLDGTDIQTRFQAAATQGDLDSLLDLIKRESGAADKVAEATKLHEGLNVIQSIGLLGTDIDALLKQAHTDLQNVRPDEAEAAAQTVIDSVNGSTGAGLIRWGIVATILVVLLLVALFAIIRRRTPAVITAGPGGPGPWAQPPWGGAYPAAGLQMPPPGPGPSWQTPDAGGASAPTGDQPPGSPPAPDQPAEP
jgi:hypothetical protein